MPNAPPELQHIINRALHKNRKERYQSANDLLTDLKQLSRDREFTAEEKKRSGQAKAAGGTPNKRRLAAIVALAGLVIVAIVAWFYFNRPPALTSKDTILLADFENQTGDAIFDGTLKQGLAIQLQQSPFLNLFAEARVRQTLRLMGRTSDERVTAEMARGICLRENLKALITGSIAPFGSHYVITLEALNGQSGESLAREQVEAENKEQVLRALSQVAARLRERLGESLSSIQRFDRSLEEATTSKLEAFKFYSEGAQQAISGREMEAIPALKRAVEIDRDFAFAYSLLALTHGHTDRPGLAAEYAEKSYALRDRVTEYEKLRITNWYHGFVTGDVNKRIETLLLEKRMFPAKWVGGPGDLAFAYNHIGQSDEAIAEAREAIRLIPSFAHSYRQMAIALLRLNRFAEAKAAIAQALQLNLDTPDFHAVLCQIAFTEGDTAGMQAQLDWARGRPDEYLALGWQAGAAAFRGEWRKAQELARHAIDLAARGDTKEVAARYATEQALRSAVFGDCRQAKADAAQGLKLARGRASLPRAALGLVLCGETNQAKPLVDELTKRYPEDTVINSIWLPAIRAAMELQRGVSGSGAAQAIEQLQPTTRYEAAAEFWPQYLRGQAYLKLRRGAEAAAEFQKILDHRGWSPASALYVPAHVWLARAAMLQGDKAKARQEYQDFLALWKNADVDLHSLIEAKKEYEKLKE